MAFIFALGLLLGPTTVLQLFGLTTGNTEKLLAQLIGASLAGFGLLGWFARDLPILMPKMVLRSHYSYLM